MYVRLEESEVARLEARAIRAEEPVATHVAGRVLELLSELRLHDSPDPVALAALRTSAEVLNERVRRLNRLEAKGTVVDVRAAEARQLREDVERLRQAVANARAGNRP